MNTQTNPTTSNTDVTAASEATVSVSQWVVPSLDVLTSETGDLQLLVDLPGVAPEGLGLEVRDGVLELDAQRADQPQRGYRRRLKLPETVDAERIAARLERGVLTLDLPVREAVRPRRIQVEVG